MDTVLCLAWRTEVWASWPPPSPPLLARTLASGWKVIMIRRVLIKLCIAVHHSAILLFPFPSSHNCLSKKCKPGPQTRAVNVIPNDFPHSQSSLENYNYPKVNITTDTDKKQPTTTKNTNTNSHHPSPTLGPNTQLTSLLLSALYKLIRLFVIKILS